MVTSDRKFEQWTRQLDLFQDNKGVWRLVNFGEGGLRLYVSWHPSKEFIFQPTTPQSMLELYPLPCAMLQQCPLCVICVPQSGILQTGRMVSNRG